MKIAATLFTFLAILASTLAPLEVKAVYQRGFSYQFFALGAWATILIEFLLAALFLGGLRVRRLAKPLALAALKLFSGLIMYARRDYGIDDCAHAWAP